MKISLFILGLALASAAPTALAITPSHLAAIDEVIQASHFFDVIKDEYRQSMAANGRAENPKDTCAIHQLDDPSLISTIDHPLAHHLTESDAKLVITFYNTHPDPNNVALSDIDPVTAKALQHLESAGAAIAPQIQQNLLPAFMVLAKKNCG